jgi:hypothetical protein
LIAINYNVLIILISSNYWSTFLNKQNGNMPFDPASCPYVTTKLYCVNIKSQLWFVINRCTFSHQSLPSFSSSTIIITRCRWEFGNFQFPFRWNLKHIYWKKNSTITKRWCANQIWNNNVEIIYLEF